MNKEMHEFIEDKISELNKEINKMQELIFLRRVWVAEPSVEQISRIIRLRILLMRALAESELSGKEGRLTALAMSDKDKQFTRLLEAESIKIHKALSRIRAAEAKKALKAQQRRQSKIDNLRVPIQNR